MKSAPIAEIAEAIIDYRGRTPPKSPNGIKLLTAKVIKGGTIDEARLEYISEETYAWWMRRGFPQQRDILLTTEAPLGEVAMLRTSEPIALAQRVILLRGDPAVIDQCFLFAALRSPLVQGRLLQRATGTTVLGIKQRELRQVEVPLPPLAVQRKIAAILSAYDDLIENNNRRIEILEEMAHRIYREWFVDYRYPGHEDVPRVDSELGPIPQGWSVAALSTLTEAITRGVSPRYADASDQLVINQRCIRGGALELALARRHVSTVPAAKMVQIGDVLINSTGVGTLGRVAQVRFAPTGLTVDSHVTIARPLAAVADPHFLGMTLLARESELTSMGVGSTGQTELGRAAIGAMKVVLPPLPLQHAFSGVVAPMRRLPISLATATTCLRAARDLLLPRLISGEIDPTDLNIAMQLETVA